MIRLRHRGRTPDTLRSSQVKKLKRHLAARVCAGTRVRSADFESYWSKPDVRDALHRMHRGKCCYCERQRDIKRESDVEHFRPKAGVQERSDHPGYWWLAYRWSNYLFACKCCNQEHKKNRFPVHDEAARAMRPTDRIAEECPLLVNPSSENPEQHISYEWAAAYGLFVKAVGTATDARRRGEKTIEILGLNRQELMSERAAVLLELEGIEAKMKAGQHLGRRLLINSAARDIRDATSATREFAGFRRAYFRAAGLGEYIADD